MNKNVYSVGQINSYIKNMFAQDFMLRNISIKGEVSNCKYHQSGHIYFSIKDETGLISAIMYRGSRSGLSFTMKEGDKVIVTGALSVYEKAGTYQITAREIELDGEGNLYLRFEALKKELEEMGMFAAEYKQAIPKYARTIGVVTAPTGAAIQDIRNISSRRNPFVQVILYPALVQGDGAVASIISGINSLENLGVDVIIVGRGGGSIEDLWAFNEEAVARAIFDCRVPTISAVGHETDWTIADFVADMRAPTPSAAAELAVFDISLVNNAIQQYKRRMDGCLSRQLQVTRSRLAVKQSKLQSLSPVSRLKENKKRLADYHRSLRTNMEGIIKDKRHRLSLLAGTLDAYSPAKKLSQGYAYVQGPDQKALVSVDNIAIQDQVSIHLIDGQIRACVVEVEKDEG